MTETVDAVLFYEHHTDWAFLRLEGEVRYGVLDAAESALYGRDDLDELIDRAEDQGDGTSRLEIGSVTITPDGDFDALTVTA